MLWCPLPAEAVGVGARWKVHRVAHTESGEETTDGTFELLGVGEAGARVRATYVRLSRDLLKKIAGLPKTIRAKATQVRETTEATFIVRSDLPLPASGEVLRTATVEIVLEARGMKPSLGFESKTELTYSIPR